ncbi:MAG: hypothetical protein ACPLPR_01365 [Bacillota bacterium]
MRFDSRVKRVVADPVFMLCAVCAASLYVACSRQGGVWDNDIFWHIKTGEYIWAARAVPRADPFSWTVRGTPWTDHEWLWQVFLYAVYAVLGWRVVPAVVLLGMSGLLWALHSLCRPGGAREKTAFECLALLVVPALVPYLGSARPQVLSYLLFAVCLVLLETYCERTLWVLPALQVLWVNSHGSFVLGIVLAAYFLAWELAARSDRAAAKRLMMVLALDLLACGANSWGYSIVHYPFWVSSSGLMRSAIVEWHSPDFKSPEGLLLAMWLVLFCAGLRKALPPAREVLLGAVFGLMALQSIRHAPYFVVCASPVVYRLISSVLPEKLVSARPGRGCTMVVAACVAAVLVTAVAFTPTVNQEAFPVRAVEYIKEHGLSRVLNYYDWGGYLIWAGVPPFIDGRADIYLQTPLFERAYRFFTLRDSPRRLLEEYGVQCVLVPRGVPAATWLLDSPSWEPVFCDGAVVVFGRR